MAMLTVTKQFIDTLIDMLPPNHASEILQEQVDVVKAINASIG
jgi:hypothetical protein